MIATIAHKSDFFAVRRPNKITITAMRSKEWLKLIFIKWNAGGEFNWYLIDLSIFLKENPSAVRRQVWITPFNHSPRCTGSCAHSPDCPFGTVGITARISDPAISIGSVSSYKNDNRSII